MLIELNNKYKLINNKTLLKNIVNSKGVITNYILLKTVIN